MSTDDWDIPGWDETDKLAEESVQAKKPPPEVIVVRVTPWRIIKFGLRLGVAFVVCAPLVVVLLCLMFSVIGWPLVPPLMFLIGWIMSWGIGYKTIKRTVQNITR